MKTWAQSLRVYLDRPVIVSLLLGFSGGLPLLLVFSTLSAWLKEAGVSLTLIGFFSWASTAYALKFLWSPVVDRVPLPLLTPWLGQRRAWLLLSQVLVAAAMVGLGSTDPAAGLGPTALFATLLAFASATQDIVIDAYRVETLRDDQQGAGAANYVTGYRVAMLCAGAGALLVADTWGWAAAYGAMAVLMGVGMATVLLSPEPERRQSTASAERDRKVVAFLARTAHLPAALRAAAGRLFEAVVCPFADFMGRPHWWVILLFIALYKYGEALLGVVANPFYLDIGFTKSEIAAVSKVFGFAMTIAGGIVGGVLVARLGVMRALLIAGVLQCLANLAFAWQAAVGHSVPALIVTISVENLTAGMATTPFVAYLAGLCNVAYTATQFALLTSLMNFGRIVLASGGGWLADRLDWVAYFVVTTAAAVPGLLILVWLMRRYPPDT
ncbi:MAG: AmpG family muropeptide MFS transporter [Hyphomicrobiales bacterium]|nr:AmpG family muropeptide MFS transporter [Hyphomicrobiales bacterium]MCP5372086.1 AmpG family muropeptide MFS transporter [Hyphomicrobiales bacterium]